MQPVERFLPGGVSLENMSSHRLIDTDGDFPKICLKPSEANLHAARKTILNKINKVG